MSKFDDLPMRALDLLREAATGYTVRDLDLADGPDLHRTLVLLHGHELLDYERDLSACVWRFQTTRAGVKVVEEYADLYLDQPELPPCPYEADPMYGSF